MPPTPIPPYATPRPGDSIRPLGIPMCQSRMAIPTWSYAMELYPPSTIVEVGSYNGGFACVLGLHAYRIGARVVSFDRDRAPAEELEPLARFLGVEFRRRDVWLAEGEIAGLVQSPGVTYLLCDGGDKRRELETMSRYAKPGDVVAAHDYTPDGSDRWWCCSEIRKDDGDLVAAANDMEPWLQDHFDAAGWLVYRRRRTGSP